MSAGVRVSAECERLRFGDFTNACITHRRNELNGIKWSQPEEDHVGCISSLGLPLKDFSYIHDTRVKRESIIHRSPSQKNSPPPFLRRNSFAIGRHNASAGVLLSSTAIWVSGAREDSSPGSSGISVSSCQRRPNHERLPETSRFR